jgi:hypothetical protein
MTDHAYRVNFRFIPRLPTAEAYDQRPFKQDFRGADALIYALKQYEQKKPNKAVQGIIHLKKGIVSKYLDGTELPVYDERKWWELGYTTCPNKCCFMKPNERFNKYKLPPDHSSAEAKAERLEIIAEILEDAEANFAAHNEHPRPMPKFKKRSVPPTREWQEFKRIAGPGGFEEQLKLLGNLADVDTISLTGVGHFFLE